MLTLTVFALVSLIQESSTDVKSFLQSDLRDISMQAVIERGNQAELRKINKDFGMAYRYPTSTLSFKDPFMMRLEVKEEDSSIVYIVNDVTQWIRLGQIKLPRQNLANKPGRRQTSLEIGILTPSILASYLDAKYVETDKSEGDAIFDLTFKQNDLDKTRFRVWLDPAKKLIKRREWFNQEGKQIATFTYSEPTQVNGIWVSTKMEVRNGDGNLAGVTRYRDIKVNTGLPDSLFQG